MSRALSSREKRLAAIVGAVAFLFANFLLVDWYWKNVTRLRADIAGQTRQLQQMKTMSGDLAFWEQSDAWLQAKQPKIDNADTAGVRLLNHVKDLAKKHAVLLENPSINVPAPQTEHVAVSVEVQTKSAWKPLIAFLHELQAPEQFLAVETANLKIDAADQTQIRGVFRIARWYAPGSPATPASR